ncbi:MAG: AsmA family protein, partial [Xanthomonadales bacterium]|nr:AsmA family protein [Xanthomonadales bacterium]
MKKLFKWLLVLVIALAAGVVVILYNPHIIKGPLERYLSDVAGYSVSLNGELEIKTGRLIEITARNVHVSGPDWAAQEDLLAVGHLNLVLNTASVFKDIVLIESVRVDDLQFNLETNDEGKGNWITAQKPSSPSRKEGDGALVVFNDIQVRNAVIRFRNGKTDVENIFSIESLSHQQQMDGMLHTTLNGDLNNRLVEYTHTVGPYRNILDRRDITYEAAGHFGELALQGDAYIDNLLAPKSPKFNLDMQGPNIDEITAMLGIDDLGGGGFSLRASGAQVSDHFEAEINGQVGDISLSATAQASDIEEFNELDLDVAINGPSLGTFTRVFGIEKWPDEPFRLKGKAKRVGRTLNVSGLTLNIGGSQLLLDALLPEFPTLDSSRIKLVISGEDVKQFHELLGIEGLATGPFNVNGNLNVSPDGVELVQVELETSLGQATLSGTLGQAPAYIGSRLDLHLDGGNANSVMSVFGIDMLPEKPFSLNTRLEIVENGLLVERGVLVTIEDERLELGGFIAFGRGSQGTDVDMRLSGKHFATVVRRHVGNMAVPDSPYELTGQIQVKEEGIRLENLEFGYEGVRLTTDGLIKLDDQLSGTALDFQINGENLSALKAFQAIGDSLDIFVPGQSYQAGGRFVVEQNRWKLNAVKSRVGKTTLDFDTVISKQSGRSGSSIRFSVEGPDLNELLIKKGEPGLPSGTFESSARIMLSDNTLSINDFNFETLTAHGQADLELGWPYNSSNNISFNVNIRGDDIRNFLPRTDSFEAEMAAFQVNAVGNKQGDLVTVKQFDSNIGNLRVSLTGQADDNPDDNQVEIAFNILSEDISKLGRLNGELLPALPLDIKADFKGDARKFIFRNLVGSLGESRLNGELDVSLKGPKPNIKLTATSDYIDIRPFLSPKTPKDETITTTKPDRLIPATPIPLETLAANNLSIKLNIGELRYLQDSITNLRVDLEQQDGSLNLSEIFYEAPLGTLGAALSVNPTNGNKADVKLDLNTKDFVFNLSGLPEEKLGEVPVFDIDFHASGKGSNLREVASTLNGSLY